MGLQISMGSGSRVLAPLTITNLYTKFGPTYAIGLVAICMVLVFIANSLAYRRMIPLDERLAREREEERRRKQLETEGNGSMEKVKV